MPETKGQDYNAKAVDQTNISDWDPQVFSDMVDLAARENYVMRDVAMTVDRRLVGSPGSSIDIRERGTATAGALSEGASASSNVDSDVTHSKVNVSVSKIGVSTNLTREAEEDALGNQMQGIAEEHGVAISDKNDQDAYDTVDNSGAANINTVTVASDGELSYTDAKDGMIEVWKDNYEADSLLIHPEFLGDLLDESKFIDASQFNSDQPIKEGRIGRFAGMDVYVSTQFNASTTGTGDTQAVILDSDNAFVEAVKREPTTEMEFNEDQDQWQIVTTMRYGHSIMNAKAICLLQNA